MNEVPSPDFVSEPGLTDLLKLDEQTDLADLCRMASTIRNQGHGNIVTYSRKVFIPLTRLCRDFCHYCTFATSPRHLPAPYMSADEAVSIAQQGAAMGCKEALFTLGEKPELRHEAARQGLADLGLIAMAIGSSGCAASHAALPAVSRGARASQSRRPLRLARVPRSSIRSSRPLGMRFGPMPARA